MQKVQQLVALMAKMKAGKLVVTMIAQSVAFLAGGWAVEWVEMLGMQRDGMTAVLLVA